MNHFKTDACTYFPLEHKAAEHLCVTKSGCVVMLYPVWDIAYWLVNEKPSGQARVIGFYIVDSLARTMVKIAILNNEYQMRNVGKWVFFRTFSSR